MNINIFSFIFLFNLSFGGNFNATKFFEEKNFTKEFYFFIKNLSYKSYKDKENESNLSLKIPYTVDYVYENYTVEDQKYDLIFKKASNKIYLDSVSFKNNELLIYYDQNNKKEKNDIETNFDEIKFTFLKKKCNNFFKSLSPYFEEDKKPSIIFNLPKIQLIGKSHYCLTCKQQNISQTNPSDLNHFLNKQHVENLNGCEVYSKDEIQEQKFLEKLSDFSKFNTLKKN